MSATPSMFMEDSTVGGIPFFTRKIKKWLPKNKKKRERMYQIKMVILTYFVYSIFNMARRPLAVVKSRIIKECGDDAHNKIRSALQSFARNVTGLQTAKAVWNRDADDWCNNTFFNITTEEVMGFLDFLYISVYGLSTCISGVIADWYNPRFYLSMGCLLSGFFCAVLALADFWYIRNFNFFSVVLILFGACQSTGWPVVLSCVTHWYSGGKRGMFFGFWNTHNYVGSIVGIVLAGIWVDKTWAFSFFIPGCILAVTALLVYTCMVVDPGDLKELDKEPHKTESRVPRERGVPVWLRSSRSITFYDAIMLPGVIEFSTCMFFSRAVGSIFLFWLASLLKMFGHINSSTAAYYSIAYVIGGSLGGIVAGVLVDIFRRSALVCTFFLLVSIPVLMMSQIYEIGNYIEYDFPMYILIGLFVEAPYIVTSTSVSADLGKHKMIKRNHRALSTIGGIMEGTGALGGAVGTYICGAMIQRKWSYNVYIMMGLQFVATLCLSRQAYKDFFKVHKRRTLTDYWRSPAL